MSAAYDPNKQGWGAAIVTTVFTLGLLFTAYTIHNNTYRHPRDPMATQVYHAEDKAAAAGGAHGGEASHDAGAHGTEAGAASSAPAAGSEKH